MIYFANGSGGTQAGVTLGVEGTGYAGSNAIGVPGQLHVSPEDKERIVSHHEQGSGTRR